MKALMFYVVVVFFGALRAAYLVGKGGEDPPKRFYEFEEGCSFRGYSWHDWKYGQVVFWFFWPVSFPVLISLRAAEALFAILVWIFRRFL